MVRRSVPLLALLAFLLAAPPAQAAYVEVARIPAAVLSVQDGDEPGELCTRLGVGSGGGSGGCGPLPPTPARSSVRGFATGGEVIVFGAVAESVARVEAELRDGRRVAGDSVAGDAYRGRGSGKVRFVLFSAPQTDPADDDGGGVVLFRLYDAGGALVAAHAPDGAQGRPVRGPVRVLTQRARGRSLVVRASVDRVLAPTPLALDRHEESRCLLLVVRTRDRNATTSTCRDAGPYRAPLALHVEPACAPLRAVLYGFVGDAVASVRLTLGGGRRISVVVRPLPAPLRAGDRYGALPLPRGEAVRAAVALDAAGRPVDRQALEEPPSGLPCSEDEGRTTSFGSLDGLFGHGSAARRRDGQPAFEAGGRRLLVREDGDRLCAAVDALAADGSDCLLPAVDPDFGVLLRARDGVAGGVVPADVSRVRVPGGATVETSDGPGYTGRYAGKVRFALVPLPAGTPTVELLAADGTLLGAAHTGLEPRPERGPRTLARRGALRLQASRYRWPYVSGGRRRTVTSDCLHVPLRGLDPAPWQCDTLPPGDAALTVAVSCAPRRTVIYGRVKSGRRVEAGLDGGATVPARHVTIPRALGGGRAALLVLPARARVTEVRVGRHRAPLELPPAAQQCGYGTSLGGFY